MPLVDPYDVERVVAASDIVQVIGERVKLKRVGSQWRGLCPFHQERTPSFNVNPERRKFHCFGCGQGGDVVDFIRETQGLDFQSALKIAADRANVHLDLEAKPGLQPGRFKKLSPDIPEEDTKEKWIDFDEIFMWRFRPLHPDFEAWLKAKGITRAAARDLARRCVLGIQRDLQLVFVYEGGVKVRRELHDSHSCYWAEGSAQIPWLAADLGRENVKRVYMCEGESDTMRLIPFLKPDECVIGLPGASWRPSPEMCWRIGAFREVVTLFDGDDAGALAEKAIHPLLLKHARGIRLGRVPMPAGKDVCTSSQMFLTNALANPQGVR